ncbi:MAG: class I SAM-dependent methyltransferase [Rhodospirillaceae bacterium]|nr:class I SAM-dependent methyltransferase [Rhodospirillaceae bacterium]
MPFYRDRVVPWLIEAAMRSDDLTPYRARVVAAARGRVLEVGVGGGLNLAHYGAAAERIIGLDPAARLLVRAAARRDRAPAPVDLVLASAEAIPLESGSIDCIVMTWTLCSVPEPLAAVREMRRVLRPDGRLLFVEHGRAPDPGVSRWQDRLTPLWRRFAGGCHLNRRIDALLAEGGFAFEALQRGYMPRGPKLATFFYEGRARPA